MVAKMAIGSTRLAKNGYRYTKVTEDGAKGWRLTHHIIAEETLGRPILPDERVVFVDKDRSNLAPENIRVEKMKKKTKSQVIAAIRAKIDELQNQLREMGEEP